ncbi:MAG: hypothetical protein J7M03_02020 [Candidatus Desulfofervidaceae bacterium]|nr:hypothetical protein [Candidatus Desulfofervidaceae bacterium]
MASLFGSDSEEGWTAMGEYMGSDAYARAGKGIDARNKQVMSPSPYYQDMSQAQRQPVPSSRGLMNNIDMSQPGGGYQNMSQPQDIQGGGLTALLALMERSKR